MLTKIICKKCPIRKTVYAKQRSIFPVFNVKPPRTFGYNWTKKKYVECCGGDVKNITSFLTTKIGIDEDPPECCPYALEHLLNGQETKHAK
jgi:hypothetical protein